MLTSATILAGLARRMAEEAEYTHAVGNLIYGFALTAYGRHNFEEVANYLDMLDELIEEGHGRVHTG